MKTWTLAFGDTFTEGEKLIYIDEHGYDSQRENARKFMDKGDILTIKECFVYDWYTNIEFEEIPDEQFNSVMFKKCITKVEIN